MSSPEESGTGPVVRDLRRIDPVTGQVRGKGQGESPPSGPGPAPGRHAESEPGAPPAAGGQGPGGTKAPSGPGPGSGPAPGPEAGPRQEKTAEEETGPDMAGAAVADELAERTLDLQRVTAEYANYRKRVERDRIAVREQALANVLAGLLPVLDDIGRAREHGELVGGFKSVADSLEATVSKLGLTSFGKEGEPFDPNVHEALMHSYSGEVTEPACVRILQPGYRVGERILRPARVAVAEPGGQSESAGDGGPAAEATGGGSTGGGSTGEGAEDTDAAPGQAHQTHANDD